MWQNPRESAGLVTFNEKILNGKLHFLSIAFSETIDAYQDVLATIFVCNPLSVFICSNIRSWEPDMNYERKNSSF